MLEILQIEDNRPADILVNKRRKSALQLPTAAARKKHPYNSKVPQPTDVVREWRRMS